MAEQVQYNIPTTSPSGQTLFTSGVVPTADTTGGAPSTPQVQSDSPPVASSQTTVPQGSTTQPATKPAQTSLSYDPTVNPSVVDLLNTAGVDSSQANRKLLAQQYGVQNYDFSAEKNRELAEKFTAAYNASKGLAVPQTGAEGRAQTQALLGETQQAQTQETGTPTQRFMDIYGSMNPIEANIFQQLSGLLSTQNTQQSFRDLYAQEVAAQGIPALNMEFADINRIMEGTEDDIRAEVGAAGGFATESQVQALTSARNKGLLKKANYLSNVIAAKNDYVDRIVSLTQADRKQVSEDLDRKLGTTETILNLTQRMRDNTRKNYESIVNSLGWGGLASMVKNNPAQAKEVESVFGLGEGELESLATYQKPLTRQEELQLENQRLQNLKLRRDLSEAPSVSTQVVDVNGRKLLINSKTGQTIAEVGDSNLDSDIQRFAVQQQTIADTDSLLKSPGLNSAVGPNFLARIPVSDAFGAKSNFIAGVEQLRQQLTLDQLIKAKGQGATFGALSDAELQLISASASKIGTWAVKDRAGNIVGYSASQKDFKKEIDKINNFQKLDFILKGGSPESVGVQVMPDGTYWTKNSDGTLTRIQ